MTVFQTENIQSKLMNSYYELTYIISPVLEDEQYPAVIQRINDLVTSNGGAIEEVQEWGLRKFAYEMDKKQTGFYVNLYFEGPATAIEPIERSMRIDDEIMRYLTLKYDAKMMRHRELIKKNTVPEVFPVVEEETEED
jgi:small subunit ribosomal protein S6